MTLTGCSATDDHQTAPPGSEVDDMGGRILSGLALGATVVTLMVLLSVLSARVAISSYDS